MVQFLLIGCAEARGLDWTTILWDLAKFYDTVGLAALLIETAANKFSPTTMFMFLLNYLAPRTLKAGVCHSEWVFPANSLLAGCGEATNTAKNALYGIIENLHNKSPARFQLYVDDLKQFDEDRCPNKLAIKAAKAGQCLAESLRKHHFVLSGKSVVVASNARVARTIVLAMAAKGVKI